ncbi:MAG TPA: ABC transporter ATP-binding protein [Candidatus Babeliales bacterium]|nr:ABC transporter ATP-binding protein [Candidatus Babeliales bacterium]
MKSQEVLTFITRVTKPFTFYIVGLISIECIWAFLMNVQPYIVKLIVNNAMNGGEQSNLFATLAPLMALYIICEAIYLLVYRVLHDWILIQSRPMMKRTIILTLMSHMFEHAHRFYQHQFAGGLTTRISDITKGIPDIIYILIHRLMACFLMLLFALANMALIHMKFAVALGIWIFVFLGFSTIWVFRNQYLAYDVADARAVVLGSVVDSLTNMMSIRLFAAKKFENQRLQKLVNNSVQKDRTKDWFFLRLHAFQGGSFLLLQAVCFWWLLNGLVNKTVTPGDFVLVLTLNLRIVETFWNIAKEMRDFWEKTGEVYQGLSIIQTPIEIKDKPDAQKLVVTKGEIVFEGVQFQYCGAESLFEHESVIIKPGQKIGLVGYSGSGKSTFVNLILRLFDVSAGRIIIDGQDIRDVTQDSLHQAIAMIPQDPALFHRSIYENIIYGRQNATQADVIAAAKRAYAHDFIISLACGYDTQVGERGVRLSGGQRQRIAIARAMLKNAPILILDEATSQLDSVTESEIQDSLWDLMRDKTTLIIAHRLSTLLTMDRILVFDKGTIVEDGSHNELLEKGGLYKQLWEAQIGGFLVDISEISAHNRES